MTTSEWRRLPFDVCSVCGALISEAAAELHAEWHEGHDRPAGTTIVAAIRDYERQSGKGWRT